MNIDVNLVGKSLRREGKQEEVEGIWVVNVNRKRLGYC